MTQINEKIDVYTEARQIRAELSNLRARVEALPENKWFVSAEVDLGNAETAIVWGISVQRDNDEKGGLSGVLVK